MTDLYDNIPQESLRWLDRLSGKTGAALPSDAQTAPTGWLPAEVSARLEPGKTYVMTINDEVLAVTAPDQLIRGLESTAPASHESGSTLYQAFTAHQLQWLMGRATGGGDDPGGQDPGGCDPAPDGPLTLSAVTLPASVADGASDSATNGAGEWVVVSGKHGGVGIPVAVSADNGVTWEVGGVPFFNDACTGVVFVGGRYMAVRTEMERHPTISASEDGGHTWSTQQNSPSVESLVSLTSGGDGSVMAIVAVKDGEGPLVTRLMISKDAGETWSATGAVDLVYGTSIASLGAGSWYALAEDPDDDYASRLCVTENDGDTWQAKNAPHYYSRLIAAQLGVVMIMTGSSDIYTSEDDGDTWQQRTGLPGSPEGWNINGISVDGKGRWLAYGNQGYLAYSDDNGESWQSVTSPVQNAEWSSARYHCGRWVIVGPYAAAISE